ncbi:MAG: GntR family transcriptional regulator [Betaproteobacteria bacterium]|nr:GntR family transcriptional regulator [Betaproteobacteria bacterium]
MPQTLTTAPEKKLLRETVHTQLRADILRCQIPPGSEIREAELATRFGVSKSPVRDALMHLEREGLVITTPRQGYRVAPISLSDVQDMFDLRQVLEGACMERIVRHAGERDLEELDEFRSFDASRWAGGFAEYNRTFHQRLAILSANRRLSDQIGTLVGQMERAVLVSLTAMKQGNPAQVIEEHGHIIDALQERNARRAVRLAEQHIESAAIRVSSALSRMLVTR